MEEIEFFHECRAAGLMFKTANDWCDWLAVNNYDTDKVVAEYDGFKWNINDLCINPHVLASYAVEGTANYNFRILTAKTQFGWLWGCEIETGSPAFRECIGYPSRYDQTAIYYETEEQAGQDACSFVLHQLQGERKTKNIKVMIWAVKKMRADLVHPQQEITFGNDEK